MKTRNGFVSNSSSSSFIITYDTNHCPYCKRGDDPLNLIRAAHTVNDDNEVRAVGADGVIDLLQNNWGKEYTDKLLSEHRQLSSDIRNATASGRQVAIISISYHADFSIKDLPIKVIHDLN